MLLFARGSGPWWNQLFVEFMAFSIIAAVGVTASWVYRKFKKPDDKPK